MDTSGRPSRRTTAPDWLTACPEPEPPASALRPPSPPTPVPTSRRAPWCWKGSEVSWELPSLLQPRILSSKCPCSIKPSEPPHLASRPVWAAAHAGPCPAVPCARAWLPAGPAAAAVHGESVAPGQLPGAPSRAASEPHGCRGGGEAQKRFRRPPVTDSAVSASFRPVPRPPSVWEAGCPAVVLRSLPRVLRLLRSCALSGGGGGSAGGGSSGTGL